MKKETIEIACQFVRHTDAAVCITDNGVDHIWIPKSQVINRDEIDFDDLLRGEVIYPEFPEWLAREKELI